jgi:Domain of Unknown Function with PDB structure (DUF3857)
LVKRRILPLPRCKALAALWLVFACALFPSRAQQPTSSQDSKSPEIPAKIGLLDTRIRFEANGDCRKEVHTRVHINNEIGARQFSRLNFDYNRAFQQIEIPSVHITHVSGGTADILPSAITDQPNPVVADVSAYQDVRVKSIRILGLSPGDDLEYRVVTSTTHGPFAPNFYVSHDFATEGLVLTELFQIDLPAPGAVKPWTTQAAQAFEVERSGDGSDARVVYRWKRLESKPDIREPEGQHPRQTATETTSSSDSVIESDIVLTSFSNWVELAKALQKALGGNAASALEIKAKAEELTRHAVTPEEKLRALYDFVSQKIATVDLPLGATGFHLNSPAEILSAGHAVPEEKCTLLSALARSVALDANVALPVPGTHSQRGPAIPTILTNILAVARVPSRTYWLDPSLEVAPFGMISSNMRGKPALVLTGVGDSRVFENVPKSLPFAASQRVKVDASLTADGVLHAKVHYTMRGENELLLRVAFHQSPREKWKDVAQLLALSDGFRGKIISASASDPYATKLPFTVDYEITQAKFVDWSKKHVRIPALLPQLGLPDPPPKPADGAQASPIDLGTPLNVDTTLTLHLPGGASAQGPTGTSVERDYATFTSHYAAEGNVVFASRHINFLLREVPAARTSDYNAFLHAVQTDQAQLFTVEFPDNPSASSTPPRP